MQPDRAIPALREIGDIVRESDISPFEVIHSGLVRALLTYLTASSSQAAVSYSTSQSSSASSTSSSSAGLGVLEAAECPPDASPPLDGPPAPPPRSSRERRLRNFLHVFLGCPVSEGRQGALGSPGPSFAPVGLTAPLLQLDPLNLDRADAVRVAAFNSLVAKLNGCVNQLEQFPVKVHDLPGSALSGSGRGGSTSAIKFFNTHQLKVSIQFCLGWEQSVVKGG